MHEDAHFEINQDEIIGQISSLSEQILDLIGNFLNFKICFEIVYFFQKSRNLCEPKSHQLQFPAKFYNKAFLPGIHD